MTTRGRCHSDFCRHRIIKVGKNLPSSSGPTVNVPWEELWIGTASHLIRKMNRN